jgi:hypothetical protein
MIGNLNENSIELSSLAAGSYFLEIYDGVVHVHTRIMKQ